MIRRLYMNGITQVKAYRILQAQVAAVVRDHGLGSVSEWFVLSDVYHNKQVMAKDIAALLDVEAPLITRLVNNLSQNNLVEISPHLTDKRIKYISPTRQADELVPRIETSLEALLSKTLHGVRQTEMANYQKVLETIIKNGETA
jgi:DNA-binding MarR family transcriptional regulator